MRRRFMSGVDFFTTAQKWISQFVSSPPFLGIDIGSEQLRIYLKERGIVLKEKMYEVQNVKTKDYLIFGDEAYDMLGKTPPNLKVFDPIERGRVSDFDGIVYVLQKAIHRALDPYQRTNIFNRFDALFSVPLGLTEVEEMAIVEVGKKVGARHVYLVETPLAAGFGLKVPVLENSGSLLVDIGGGTTEVSVVSLGGVVLYKVLKIGGKDFNDGLTNYIRLRYGVLIGEKTAEQIKLSLGSMLHSQDDVVEISGRSIETGMPKTVSTKVHLLFEPLYPFFGQIIEAIKEAIEETPPELLNDIKKKGIMLTGMSANFVDFDNYLHKELGMDIVIAQEPEYSVIRGLGFLIEHQDIMEKVGIRYGKI
jgi:rod shape-determining protein MreB and related proteins